MIEFAIIFVTFVTRFFVLRTYIVVAMNPVAEAAGQLLHNRGGSMLLSQFIADLYEKIPIAAKEQIAAAGGPKKWANTSGFTITYGPKPGMETIAKAGHSTAPPHRCKRGVASSSCSSAALAAAPRTSKAPTAAAGKAPAMTDMIDPGRGARPGFFDAWQVCEYCRSKAVGRTDTDGVFYCNSCWKSWKDVDVELTLTASGGGSVGLVPPVAGSAVVTATVPTGPIKSSGLQRSQSFNRKEKKDAKTLEAAPPASRVNERPRDLELRLSLDRQASPAEKERYANLNPGGVFACFKETFELGPKHFGTITFHAGNFSVPLRLIDDAAERAIKELTVRPRWRVKGTALFVRQGSDKQAASPREQHTMPSHGSARPPAAVISEDIAKFWARLKTALEGGIKVDALKLHEPHSRQLWLACWKAAAAGVSGSGHDVLLKVLLKAAATSNLAPPPLVRGCVLIPQPMGPHLSAA